MFDELREFNPSKYTPMNAPTRVRRMWAHRAHVSHRKNLRKNLTACQSMLSDMADSAALPRHRNPFTRRGYEATIKKNEHGEYVVKFWKDGKWLGEGPTYYADDKKDAQDTAKFQLARYNEMDRETSRNPELLVWRNPGRRRSGLSASWLVVKRRKTKMRRRRKHRRKSRNGRITIKVGGRRIGWKAAVKKFGGVKAAAKRWRKAKKFHAGKMVCGPKRRRKSRRSRR